MCVFIVEVRTLFATFSPAFYGLQFLFISVAVVVFDLASLPMFVLILA